MIDMKAEVNGLNEKVVKMLAERKMTVSAAESCTGGLCGTYNKCFGCVGGFE